MSDFTPLRSVLYMPSSNAKAVEKAKTLTTDAVIFDLEDAVAPDAKVAARAAAVAAVQSGEYGRRTLTIRVNGIGTEWHDDDLAAAAAAGPHAIVVPKVNTVDDLNQVVAGMEAAGAPEHTTVWAMIETPAAIFNAREIAGGNRISAFVMGTNDLVKELYAEHIPGRENILTSLQLATLAAREHGIAILDGVYNDVRNLEGFEAECEQGRNMGMDGKTLIHPGQLEGANKVFAPSDEAVENAKGLIAAWNEGGAGGVVTFNGRLVENLHVDSAKRTLDIADAIAAFSAE